MANNMAKIPPIPKAANPKSAVQVPVLPGHSTKIKIKPKGMSKKG
jgi:hypothetical protein